MEDDDHRLRLFSADHRAALRQIDQAAHRLQLLLSEQFPLEIAQCQTMRFVEWKPVIGKEGQQIDVPSTRIEQGAEHNLSVSWVVVQAGNGILTQHQQDLGSPLKSG